MTVLAQFIAYNTDSSGYTTYVFQCLDKEILKISKYIMCVRYPRWEHRNIDLGEIGFLTFKEVQAGVDTWYNGNKMIPYKYDAVQFIKFIEKPKELSKEYIM